VITRHVIGLADTGSLVAINPIGGYWSKRVPVDDARVYYMAEPVSILPMTVFCESMF